MLLSRACLAQMMVRPSTLEAQSASDPANADPLQSVADGANPPPAPPSDDDALIRDYIDKAGPVGARKLFSRTKFTAVVGVGVTYDDNILLSSTGPRRSDVITSVTGGLGLSCGDFAERASTFLVVGYTGTGSIFAKHGGEDAYDQKAVLDVQYRPHDLSIASSSVFQELHDADADLGQRVGRSLYNEDVTLKWYRSDLTTLIGDVSYWYDNYDTGIDSSELDVTLAVDHVLTGKVTGGLGVVFERLTATGGIEEYAEQAEVRFGYAISQKIVLTSSGGVEYRERGGGAGDSVTPVFSLTGKWTPFVGTTLDIDGHRRTEASGALDGEDFVDTGVQLGVRQDLFQRVYVRLDLGYQNGDYEDVTAGESIPRNDNFISVRGTAGYDFIQWFQVLAFYEHREDDSTRANFSFVSNRIGMQVNMAY